ncbi:MAG: MFS transporter [Verrucomicrobia bacterium]|nr:MAG: MFS transporter [Verrucomicrobiota bacterium]
MPHDSAPTPPNTAPHAASPSPAAAKSEDDRLPVSTKAAYAFGGVNDIFGHWWYANIAGNVFNMHLHLAPTLIAVVLTVSRIVDAFTDMFFGWVSDNTRSRWGRRRPWILGGSIAAGLALPCLFFASESWDASAPWMSNRLFWFMLISAVLYAPIISAYTMPYNSLGAELTPNYHERTNVMAWKAIVQKISGIPMMSVWWFAQTFHIDPATGKPDVLLGVQVASAAAGLVMILAGVANFRFVRERYYATAARQERTRFLDSLKTTFRSRPFLILLGILAAYAIPTMLVTNLGGYVSAYYVFGGDQARMGQYQSFSAVAYFVLGTAGVFVTSWVSRRFGKRLALTFTLVTGILAFGSSWWMYAPGHGWMVVLNTAFTGFAATGFWVVLPSMSADVVDDDELNTGKRREGAFSSVFSWISKVGMSLAVGGSFILLDLVGFDATREGNQSPEAILWIRLLFAGIPVVAMATALALLTRYPLNQKRMAAIRTALEQRRGTV